MNQYKILIVDDEQNVCEFLGEFLQDKGYLVIKARSGSKALRYLEKNNPDLVLLDILMPGMSGLEVLKRIRKLYPDLPVIILTGVKDKQVVDDIINVGPVDFIPKPIDLDVLEKCISSNLAKK
ncbi:MAG TPA: response regulator [Candidatus Marinimicrobia bacterium]|jgi:CheY-like chemotaxis protein|nr:response regulator [Candidatus Neomarinimicrobiota bacterium]HPX99868.1 response regulator [Candidatus Neomarinimicrobiota bacterium]HQC61622.1 response regulator [Candidatus Neomarinimicrobiota bacterium]HQO73280.1 response regulator [Candidatus Neomarinimicrobiota bacterium]HQQ84745.1 response regulator [Candidatus Neomarinimicrobiota bacterium]